MPNERRYALITGAASGLGRAIALRLARDGWCIAIADIQEAESQETLDLVKKSGGTGLTEQLDITQVDQWESLRDRLQSEWPQLDLLVNNAGVAASGDVGKFSLEDWRWIMDINLYGAIYGCHVLVDWLKSNPRGSHIINTASLAGIVSAGSMAAYNVTKAGVISLSETLSVELREHNVGVTVVCPSFFPTNLLATGRFTNDSLRRLAEASFRRAAVSADGIAEQAVRGMYKKRLYVVVPAQARHYWYFKRLMPERFFRTSAAAFVRQMQKMQKRGEPVTAAR